MSVVKELYKGRIVHLFLEDVTLPNEVALTLEIVRHPGASAVVALDDVGNVILLRQYRHAVGGFLWEIPAGKLDGDEAPEVCATRELREEAGLQAGELRLLGAIYTAPGFCDEKIHLFLARDLTAVPQQLEEDEVLTVERVPLRRALEMIRSGEIQDAKSIAGLHHTAALLGVA